MDEEQSAVNSNPEFERRVLSAALYNEQAWDAISVKLRTEDFTTDLHQLLFQEIGKADEQRRRDDPVLIAQALSDQMPGLDGYATVASLVGVQAPLQTLDVYIETLKTHTNARKMADIGHSVAAAARTVGGDPEELAALLAAADDQIRDVSEETAENPWVDVASVIEEVESGNARLDATFPTGFVDLDNILQGGFRPGQMVTVAARPAQGKSTITLDFARYASLQRGIPGMFISLEMSAEELGVRLVAAEGGITLGHLITGELDSEEQAIVRDLRQQLADAPLYIMDATEGTWGSIRAAIISAHRRLDIKFVVIDYLQLVTQESKSKSSNRQEEVATISRAIKMLAKMLGITIIAVAQLNRGPEQRADKMPQASDLRESGSIEQDSDVICLIHRPDASDPQSERPGEGDVIVAKQRNGPTGVAALAFQGHYARFKSLARNFDPYAYANPAA